MTQQAPPPLLSGPATLDPACHAVAGGQWVEEELNLSRFRDQRIRKRLYRLVQQLADHIGEPIPNACQNLGEQQVSLPPVIESESDGSHSCPN
jgi:hypothetical protein